MAMAVILEKVKGVEHLEFKIPSTPGVKLVVGPNGSGKTSLLVALAKIGNPNAFSENFKTIKTVEDIVKQYSEATITYKRGDEKVVFSKKEQRWMSSPAKGAKSFFEKFGFASVQFIKVDNKRLESITQEVWNQRQTSLKFSNIISKILDNKKFESMKSVKQEGGRIIPLVKTRNGKYYPDTYFSTGELGVFSIVRRVEQCSNHSLILIDEVGMSLHPKVQLNLLRYLKKVSIERNLTIIISTHSVPIIRDVSPADIYFLASDDATGEVHINNPCYPTFALRGVALADDIPLDYVVLVEDDEAKLLVEQIIDAYYQSDTALYRLLGRILPIGGWNNTLDFYNENRGIFQSSTKPFVILDNDAIASINNSPHYNQIYNKIKANVRFLPITPEQGIIDFININETQIMNKMAITISLKGIIQSNRTMNPKEIYKDLIERLSIHMAIPRLNVKQRLYKTYVALGMDRKGIKSIVGYLLNKK